MSNVRKQRPLHLRLPSEIRRSSQCRTIPPRIRKLQYHNMVLFIVSVIVITATILKTCKEQQQIHAFHIHQNVMSDYSFHSKNSYNPNMLMFARLTPPQQQRHQHQQHPLCCVNHDDSRIMERRSRTTIISKLQKNIPNFWNRFDTIQKSLMHVSTNDLVKRNHQSSNNTGIPSTDIVLTSGIASGLFGTIKKIHNPIFYFIVGILAGFRYDWCFKSPVYWFAIGFTIKWYRARYVFKIPVWDRQPNWNNIITSKEQEKDLKAFTCKNCGSTLFIAKTREFFFEGNTGFGGLGCFTCGAKGKDNFVMDRERIVEDVGDMDDYFEYERPLDFISRAERRKLLKETKGDEDKANQLLLDRTTGISSTSISSGDTMTASTIDAVIVDTTDITNDTSDSTEIALMEISHMINEVNITTKDDGSNDDVPFEGNLDEHESIDESSLASNGETVTIHDKLHESKPISIISASSPTTSLPTITTTAKLKPKSATTSLGLDGLDELDMDAW
jgi:hypothetical protein